MRPEDPARRFIVKALAGAGCAGMAYGALGATRVTSRNDPPPNAATGSTAVLPLLGVADDWQDTLTHTPQVQLEPGATYRLAHTIELPDNCLIDGNGATVMPAHHSGGAFAITRRHHVCVRNVVLQGQTIDPIGGAPLFGHVAVRATRSSDVRVENCDFSFWRGAGIVLTGSTEDDYFAYRTKLVGNNFHRCYFGVSIADRAEYGQLLANNFTSCRLAIWDSAGNWTINDNLVVACHGGYYSIAQPSPYGDFTSDNWGHGTLVGNTFNHCNAGAENYWSAHAAFPVGGVARDPGSGLVVEGVLPPTFTGNTLWYSNIHARDILGTRWLLSGCVLSNLAVSCDGAVPVELAGTQANGSENLPRLNGNVKSLF